MFFIRLAGFFFAFVQITLALRLILPFVQVPPGLTQYVPTLIDITDLWMAPVLAVTQRFELTGLADDLATVGEGAVTGPQEFEPLILVAMVFWVGVAMFGLFVLRLIFRPIR